MSLVAKSSQYFSGEKGNSFGRHVCKSAGKLCLSHHLFRAFLASNVAEGAVDAVRPSSLSSASLTTAITAVANFTYPFLAENALFKIFWKVPIRLPPSSCLRSRTFTVHNFPRTCRKMATYVAFTLSLKFVEFSLVLPLLCLFFPSFFLPFFLRFSFISFNTEPAKSLFPVAHFGLSLCRKEKL